MIDRPGTSVRERHRQFGLAEDQLVAGHPACPAGDAEPGAGVPLRVEIDDAGRDGRLPPAPSPD